MSIYAEKPRSVSLVVIVIEGDIYSPSLNVEFCADGCVELPQAELSPRGHSGSSWV